MIIRSVILLGIFFKLKNPLKLILMIKLIKPKNMWYLSLLCSRSHGLHWKSFESSCVKILTQKLHENYFRVFVTFLSFKTETFYTLIFL
jgi:hypothetical protein